MVKPKLYTCKVCRRKYQRRSAFQVCCCADCAYELVKRQNAKKAKAAEIQERMKIKQRIAELKPIQYWLKRAEKACNAYIRERDKNEPCISCGKWDAMEFHAGHFIPVGRAKSIRFDENNIHKQCDQCNTHFNGNATAYEMGLIRKIGLAKVERLKTAPKEKKWTREECQAIEAEYKAKLKALKV